MTDAAQVVDVRGMACSDAVVRLHRTIMPLPRGTPVVVQTDDPEVLADLRRYANRSGHAWGPEGEGGGVITVEVRRGG